MKRAVLCVALAVSCVADPAAAPRSFVRLDRPQPGEWRYAFVEPVQSIDDFRATVAARPLPLDRIDILPVGGSPDAVDRVARVLEAYYAARVTVHVPRPMPPGIPTRPTRGYGTRYHAEDLLSRIPSRTDHDRGVVLVVVDEDLYATSPIYGELEFVFGIASAETAGAVVSTARFHVSGMIHASPDLLLRRLTKVAIHEIGHALGLAHCREFACIMNGTNSIEHADARPIHLCPGCRTKLLLVVDTERVSRYDLLSGVYRGLGWDEEASFVEQLSLEGTGPQ